MPARQVDYDVLVLGGAGVDTIVRVPELRIDDYVAQSGNGVALGLRALGLRALGLRPKFADFLGDDAPGDLVRARYAKTGPDFTALPALGPGRGQRCQ
jgi:sugar/nucleoside kinase (ribokinase family)